MALGVPKGGKIVALDKESKTNQAAVNFFKKAGQDNKIKTIVKPALDTLRELKENNDIFDLVFIDADKENYKKYYDYGLQLIKKNGLIIIDNVLWHGEVADNDNNEKFTKIIRDFNNYVKNDKRVEQIILPIGDGLTICSKL